MSLFTTHAGYCSMRLQGHHSSSFEFMSRSPIPPVLLRHGYYIVAYQDRFAGAVTKLLTPDLSQGALQIVENHAGWSSIPFVLARFWASVTADTR